MNRKCFALLVAGVLSSAGPATAQGSVVVKFPLPANFYQNTTFVLDGDVGFVPTDSVDRLWSFSAATGLLLDPDGLDLPSPAQASDPVLLSGGRLALPGWFPSQGIFIADVSDPTDLKAIGVIPLPAGTNVQSEILMVADNGNSAFLASFADDVLYSIDLNGMALDDPDGVALPGNPDRTTLAGDRVALADSANGEVMVVDVSNPSNLVYAGSIAFPGPTNFYSADTIVFAADDRTGFISSNQGQLLSFDVLTLALLDPDGLFFPGFTGSGPVAIHGDVVAVHCGTNGVHFVDVSDATDMQLIAQADYPPGPGHGEEGGPSGFSADGLHYFVHDVWPLNAVYCFEVATGALVNGPFIVGSYPSWSTTFGQDERLAVLCAASDEIHLVHGLLLPPAPHVWCAPKVASAGCVPSIGWSGSPSLAGGNFQITAGEILGKQYGLMFYGYAPNFLPFQDGRMCVGGNLHRTPVQHSGGSSFTSCDGSYSFDFGAWMQSGVDPGLAAGTSVYAQYWYRDPTSASTTGLSDALQFVVLP